MSPSSFSFITFCNRNYHRKSISRNFREIDFTKKLIKILLPEVHDLHLVMPPWPKIFLVLSSHLVILEYLVPPNLSSYIFQKPRAEFWSDQKYIIRIFPIYGSRNNLGGNQSSHSSEIRGLRLMKLSGQNAQHRPEHPVLFKNPKLLEMMKRKNYLGFLIPKI